MVVLQITPAERTTLQWLADGKDAKDIALGLGISVLEAEARLTALFARMGARTTTEAISAALSRGLVGSAPQWPLS